MEGKEEGTKKRIKENEKKVSREKYVKKRKEYKIWCGKEIERHEKEKEEKLEVIKTEA